MFIDRKNNNNVTKRRGMVDTTLEKQRCIYEDENILVEHSFATFGSGTKEAVLAVHTKKDGVIWQTETGATPNRQQSLLNKAD